MVPLSTGIPGDLGSEDLLGLEVERYVFTGFEKVGEMCVRDLLLPVSAIGAL